MESKNERLKQTRRITSYNVCYTKLLRCATPIRHPAARTHRFPDPAWQTGEAPDLTPLFTW